MKEVSKKKTEDDLRAEYDLSQLGGGVRGKYYREATAGEESRPTKQVSNTKTVSRVENRHKK
jgi:hypothetical protein